MCSNDAHCFINNGRVVGITHCRHRACWICSPQCGDLNQQFIRAIPLSDAVGSVAEIVTTTGGIIIRVPGAVAGKCKITHALE